MEHCVEQGLTLLSAGHDIHCMFTTPKFWKPSQSNWRNKRSDPQGGSAGSSRAARNSLRSGIASPTKNC